MSSALLGSAVSHDLSSHRPRSSSLARVAVIATILVYAVLALYQLGKPDLDADEGRYGTSALNILYDYHQIAIVSPDPAGVPWSTWPYMYPLELAGSILLLGKNELALRFVNVVLMVLSALCIYRLAVLLLKDRTVGLLAFGLFLLNPATIAYARSAMAEPSVVFWGCVALVAAASYSESGQPWQARAVRSSARSRISVEAMADSPLRCGGCAVAAVSSP